MSDFSQRPKGQTSAHPLQWLSTRDDNARILTRARQLIALEQALRSILPAPLAPHCHAVQYQDQVLTVAVPGHQHASRLRQIVPRLLQGLQSQRWQVAQIQLQIQKPTSLHPAAPENKPIKKLSPAAISAFAELKNELPDGPLAKAIENLIENHQSKQAPDQ